MKRSRPPSPQTLATLRCLAIDPSQWLYGLEISKETGLKSGTLYPILARCAERGLLESQWLEPSEQGRPPRHAYRITAAGVSALRKSAERQTTSTLKEKPA